LHDMTTSEEHAVQFDNGPFGSLVDGNTNWKWRRGLTNNMEEEDDENSMGAPEIGILGSGSDYTVFLDHFGIPSLDFSFGKRTTRYGQYHSIYDSFSWMDRFGGRDGQPGSSFELMAFAAKIWGLLAMRLATSPLVPLDHLAQGVALSQYVTAIEQQQQPSPSVDLDLRPLKEAVQSYQEAAASLQLYCFKEEEQEEDTLSTCNEKLGLTERHFLDEKNGLPGRPWFRHVLQAPGMDLGYAAQAFPGIQQAIDDGNWTLAQEQVMVAGERIRSAATHLKP
jgi:N-acetylated-alpha-linked acidic dipeptidase